MARKPRLEFPGAFYHVVTRGNNRQSIFFSNKDRLELLDRIKDYIIEFKFNLYAYVFMMNHIHLLIETPLLALSKMMQRLLTSYTQYFNQKYKRVGHLFQGRYKAMLCDKDGYLLELVRYIHLNPVRAGKVSKAEDYEWSSHCYYLGTSDVPWLSKSLVLEVLGGRKAYREFIEEGLVQGGREDLCQLRDGQILGDDEFVKKVQNEGGEIDQNHSLLEFPLEDLLNRVSHVFSVSASEIIGREQTHKISLARRAFVYFARCYCGYSSCTLGEFLRRDPSGIPHSVKQIKSQLHNSPKLRSLIDRIKYQNGHSGFQV